MVKGKIRYHRAYLRLHGEWEDYAAPIIKKALDEQVKPAIALISEQNLDNIDFYLSYLSDAPIREALLEIYPVIGSSAARFSYGHIYRQGMERKSIEDIFAFFNPEWVREMVDYFLLNAGAKIKGITDTTIKEIRRIIAESQEQNMSRREQAKYITDQLQDPDFNRKRSLVIARTESTTAANHGINLGADSSDYYVNKYWIDTKDARTRRDHRIAGMQEPIPFTAMFQVGTSLMAYPGDATAPADEVVNCRCVMGTVVVTDADGLPILKPRQSRVERV